MRSILTKEELLEKDSTVRNFVLSKGGHFNSEWHYTKSGERVEVTCENGHTWTPTAKSLFEGTWCRKCRKISKEDIQKLVESQGGTLDSDFQYVNNKTPIKITCEEKHVFYMNWVDLSINGYWCPHKYGKCMDQSKIIDHIENNGGTVDTDWVYETSNTKIKITCKKERHIWYSTWSHLQGRSVICPHCRGRRIRKDITPEEILLFIKNKEGHVDPDWVFVNTSTKFWVTCDKHQYRWKTRWSSLQDDHWCPKCFRERHQDKLSNDEIEVRKYIEGRGIKLDPDWKYVNQREIFWAECTKDGYRWKTSLKFLKANIEVCPKCRDQVVDEEKIRIFKEYVEVEKEASLPENWAFVSTSEEFNIKCRKGHVFKSNWTKVNNDSWCPQCNDSVQEVKLRKMTEEIFSTRFPKNRPDWLRSPKTGYKLELDGYSEEKKIAFEYQGPYHYDTPWLSPEKRGDLEYQQYKDAYKVQKCKEEGVILIVIPYWIKKKNWKEEILNQYNQQLSEAVL